MDFDIAARNGVCAAASWIIPRACHRIAIGGLADKEGYPDEQSRGQQILQPIGPHGFLSREADRARAGSECKAPPSLRRCSAGLLCSDAEQRQQLTFPEPFSFLRASYLPSARAGCLMS
jgi:hypothetical protein